MNIVFSLWNNTYLSIEFNVSETEGKRMNKVSSSTHFSGKRIAENVEVAPAAKRQALEMSMGSPKASSPNRMGVLSRESSFKNLDKERVRSAQQTCLGNQSTNDMLETSRSSTAGPRLQTPKGKQIISFASHTCLYICLFIFPLHAWRCFTNIDAKLVILRFLFA